MARNLRFIASITTTAAHSSPQLPWTRGATRKAFIEKRSGIVMQKAKTA